MSDLLKLANLLLEVYKRHEASYVRVEGGIGHYSRDQWDLINEVAAEHGLSEHFIVPAQLMQRWHSDVSGWADKLINATKDEAIRAANNIDADRTALAEIHAHVEAGGFVQNYRAVGRIQQA